MTLDRLGAVLLASILSGVLGIIFSILILLPARKLVDGIEEKFLLIFRLIVPVLSLFAIIFPLVDLVFTRFHGPGWRFMSVLSVELSSGRLPARLSSCLVGALGLRASLATIHFDEADTDQIAASFSEVEELYQITIRKIYRNRHASHLLDMFQCGYYLWAAFVYWYTDWYAEPAVAVSPALLALALFFIIDDWRTIFSFSLALKGHIPRGHLRLVWFFNAVIFALAACCLYGDSFVWPSVALAVGAGLLFYAGYFSFGYQVPGLTSYFSGTLSWVEWEAEYPNTTGGSKHD